METVYYFAYGSNMDAYRMKERGVNFSKRIFAQLPYYRLEFNKISSKNEQEGFANIVANSNNLVEGILYEIPKSDLEKLDKHEGVPNHYTREVIDIKLGNNNVIQTFVYIAKHDKTHKNLKPTREYLNHLLEGQDILSEKYYAWLKSIETLD